MQHQAPSVLLHHGDVVGHELRRFQCVVHGIFKRNHDTCGLLLRIGQIQQQQKNQIPHLENKSTSLLYTDERTAAQHSFVLREEETPGFSTAVDPD
jgi:hypothetical protein